MITTMLKPMAHMRRSHCKRTVYIGVQQGDGRRYSVRNFIICTLQDLLIRWSKKGDKLGAGETCIWIWSKTQKWSTGRLGMCGTSCKPHSTDWWDFLSTLAIILASLHQLSLYQPPTLVSDQRGEIVTQKIGGLLVRWLFYCSARRSDYECISASLKQLWVMIRRFGFVWTECNIQFWAKCKGEFYTLEQCKMSCEHRNFLHWVIFSLPPFLARQGGRALYPRH
jgi:hypothetical protein